MLFLQKFFFKKKLLLLRESMYSFVQCKIYGEMANAIF